MEHAGGQLELAVQRHHLGATGTAAATGHEAVGQVAVAGGGVDGGQGGGVDGPLDEIHVAPEAGAPRLLDVGGHVAVGVALQEAVIGAAQLELGGGVQGDVGGCAAEVDAGDAALDFRDDGGGVEERGWQRNGRRQGDVRGGAGQQGGQLRVVVGGGLGGGGGRRIGLRRKEADDVGRWWLDGDQNDLLIHIGAEGGLC